MIDLNRVLLSGNLCRDPEQRQTAGGLSVASFTLAYNRRGKDKDKAETVFVDVTAWEKVAEFCGKYLRKGAAVLVEGRLKQDEWQDKATGDKRTKIGIVAERIQFAASKGEDDGAKVEAKTETVSPRPASRSASTAGTEADLPF